MASGQWASGSQFGPRQKKDSGLIIFLREVTTVWVEIGKGTVNIRSLRGFLVGEQFVMINLTWRRVNF